MNGLKVRELTSSAFPLNRFMSLVDLKYTVRNYVFYSCICYKIDITGSSTKLISLKIDFSNMALFVMSSDNYPTNSDISHGLVSCKSEHDRQESLEYRQIMYKTRTNCVNYRSLSFASQIGCIQNCIIRKINSIPEMLIGFDNVNRNITFNAIDTRLLQKCKLRCKYRLTAH